MARPVGALAMLGSLASAVPPPGQGGLPFPFSGQGRAVRGSGLALPVSPVAALPGGIKPVLPVAPADAVRLNALRPFDGPPEAVPGFRFAPGAAERARAVQCLAAAAWYEAGDDPVGERAVIQVVLNRVRHPSYPKSVCGVVFEGSARRTGCQFTFTCDGALARTPGDAAWKRARALAEAALDGAVDPTVGAATHYHADYVIPRWASQLNKLAQVGAHIFYRFPGYWGERRVLRTTGFVSEPVIPALVRFSPAHAPQDGGDMPAISGADASGAALVGANGTVAGAAADLPPGTLPMGARSSSAILLAVDSAGPPGRWALDAMARCRGRDDCQVIAWGSVPLLERNRQQPAEQRDRPLFLYVRDRASGMAVALWDCGLVVRPDPAQCLPADPVALRRLLRDRG